VELSGLPPTGRWTILSTTGGLTITGTGPSVILEELATNTHYSFMVVSEAGCYSALSEKVTLNVREELFIPEGFSPNGDGINDYFEITWLRNDPSIHARMIIFDRRGNRIFEKENYGNKEFWKNIPSDMWWNGNSESGNLTNGYKVPEGNYYYILDMGKGKMIKGTVMVKYRKAN
jgi:gliding motility-associated-like protein